MAGRVIGSTHDWGHQFDAKHSHYNLCKVQDPYIDSMKQDESQELIQLHRPSMRAGFPGLCHNHRLELRYYQESTHSF